MALHKQHAVYRVDAGSQQQGGQLAGAAAQGGGFLPHRQRVQVGHHIQAVVVVLQQRPVAHRAHVVAQRGRAGGLDAGQNALAFGLRLRGSGRSGCSGSFRTWSYTPSAFGRGYKKTAPVQRGTAPAPRPGMRRRPKTCTRTGKFPAVPPCLPQKLRPLSEARMPGIRGPGPVTGAAVGGYRARCAGRSPPPSANHLSGCFPPGFQLLRALCGGVARFYFRVSGLGDARSMAHIAYRYSSTSGGVCQGQGLAAAMRLCYIYLYH